MLARGPRINELTAADTPPGSPLAGHFDTTLVRAVAALLIINSHAERLYPVRWLADGGQLGITLFFIVAGIGTATSRSINAEAFPRWYARRLLRLYPSIWIVILAFQVLLLGEFRYWRATDYVRRLIYPIEGYTFFNTIIVCYALGYCLVRWLRRPLIDVVVAAMALTTLALAVPDVVRLEPGERLHQLNRPFMLMLSVFTYVIGIWVGVARPGTALSRRALFMALVGLSIAYAVMKYAMVLHGQFARGFPLLWTAIILWCLCLVEIGRREWKPCRSGWGRMVRSAVALVAALSLETFLIHVQLPKVVPLKVIPFPLNLLTLLALTLVISWGAARLAEKLRNPIEARLRGAVPPPPRI